MSTPDRAARAARRAGLRATHPDLGGSADAFLAALAQHRDEGRSPRDSDRTRPDGVEVVVVPRSTRVHAVVAPLRGYVHRRLVRTGLVARRVV